MKKTSQELKAVFVIFTRVDSGLKEGIDILRIKEFVEQADGTTFLFTKYDVKTGEIYGHAVKESFETVVKLLQKKKEIQIINE